MDKLPAFSCYKLPAFLHPPPYFLSLFQPACPAFIVVSSLVSISHLSHSSSRPFCHRQFLAWRVSEGISTPGGATFANRMQNACTRVHVSVWAEKGPICLNSVESQARLLPQFFFCMYALLSSMMHHSSRLGVLHSIYSSLQTHCLNCIQLKGQPLVVALLVVNPSALVLECLWTSVVSFNDHLCFSFALVVIIYWTIWLSTR